MKPISQQRSLMSTRILDIGKLLVLALLILLLFVMSTWNGAINAASLFG